jgi:hypothetical protein
MRTSLEAVCCWGLRADRHVGHPGPPGPYVYKDGRQNHDARAGPLAMVLTVVTEIRLPRYPPASHPRNRWNVVEVEEFLTWRLSATVGKGDASEETPKERVCSKGQKRTKKGERPT